MSCIKILASQFLEQLPILFCELILFTMAYQTPFVKRNNQTTSKSVPKSAKKHEETMPGSLGAAF